MRRRSEGPGPSGVNNGSQPTRPGLGNSFKRHVGPTGFCPRQAQLLPAARGAWPRSGGLQCPANGLTVLDTHGGIGIIDIGSAAHDRIGQPGLVPPDQLDRLVERIHANSGGQSREATGAAASNLDLYQVNCTFYDALGRDDNAYLLARAVQFFLPGIPQVYYVGLLAGQNDMALLKQSGVGRDINRHRFNNAEVSAALAKPVVQNLLALIRLRSHHAAFGGRFECLTGAHPEALTMRWTSGAALAELSVDFATLTHELHFTPV